MNSVHMVRKIVLEGAVANLQMEACQKWFSFTFTRARNLEISSCSFSGELSFNLSRDDVSLETASKELLLRLLLIILSKRWAIFPLWTS